MAFGGGMFGKWLGHEGGAIMKEISALIKLVPSPLLPCEVGYSRKMNEPSPDTKSAGTLIPGLVSL